MRHTPWKRGSALVLAAGLAFGGLAACGSDDDDTSTDAGSDAGSSSETTADQGDGGIYGDGGSDVATTVVDDGAEASGDVTITISGSEFTVSDVAAGGTVTISNEDGFGHTVTSDDDAFEEVSLSGSSTGELTAPAEPGEYAFHCEIHRFMEGTLTVT